MKELLISELIAVLQERLARHGDRRVACGAAGEKLWPTRADVYLDKRGDLVIEGDGYKVDWAVDPQEGESP